MIGEPEVRPLGAARVAFGIVFLLRTTPLLAVFDPPFLRGGNGWLGWPDAGAHVPMLGLALPSAVVAMLVVVRTVAALGLLLGVRTRVCGLVAGIAGYLVLAQDAFGYFHHLHMLYLGAILFAVVDADAALALRLEQARSPRSSLVLMRVFVASIYLWAAIGKLASEWGTGAALAMFRESGALERVASVITPESAAAIEVGVVAGELAIGAGLLWPRTRRVALGCALALHVMFEIVARVDTIGWQMCALLLVFTRSGPPRRATP
ncbi:MAG: HTTM domain-containing protein [Deltaproteobacteria bacterium]|nr:HTTM domain-containing protein [Deltaproteobacteria bacterium]